MKKRTKLFIIFSAFSFLYLIYYIGVPAVLNTKFGINLIQNIIQKESGFNVVLDKPRFKMGYLPSVWLKADNIKIDDVKSTPLLISHPKLKIALFPLAISKTHVLNFFCDGLKINLLLDNDKKLYVGNFPIIKLSNSKLSFDGAKINVRNYSIDFTDNILSKKILLTGKYFIVHEFNPESCFDFSTDSKLISQNTEALIKSRIQLSLPLKKNISTANFVADGEIKNLNLNLISPYALQLYNPKISKMGGIVNLKFKTEKFGLTDKSLISNLEVKNGFLYLNNSDNKIILPEKLSISSKLDFLNKDLKIEKLNVISNSINLGLSGIIYDIAANNSKLDLKFNMFNSKSNSIIAALPAINIPDLEINIPILKKYPLYSDVTSSLDIKGNIKKPSVYGNLIFENAYIDKPLNIPKALIKMIFTGKRFKLDVIAPASESEKVFVIGDINLYDKNDVALDIKSTSNINLYVAETILLPLHEILEFPLGPVPVMNIKGTGNIDLKTKGGKLNPHLYGIFNFKNAVVSFNDIHNCVIENGEGVLKFDDTNFYFITNNATLFSKPIKVEGKCDINGKLNFYITALSANLNKLVTVLKTSPMLADFKKNVDVITATSGNVSLKLNLTGTAKDMSDFIIGKNVDVSGDIKLPGNDIIIRGLNAHLRNLVGNIHFKNNDIDFDLYPLTSKNKRYRVKGKKIDEKLYTKLKLDKLNFVFNDIPLAFSAGTVDISGDRVLLKKISGQMDSKPFFADGFIDNALSKPSLDIYITSKIKQNFIDKYINNKNIYPFITKGDISYTAKINGTFDNLNVKSNIKIPEDSSIYYLGATIGDVLHPIILNFDINLRNKSILEIKNFQYDKYVMSPNNRQIIFPQLNAKGIIDYSNNNNINFKNFRVKTFVPTDAKVFNVMFKKIFIKKGTFDSNIVVNGAYPNLKILGKLNLDNIDIPFLDTTIKDIDLNFKEKNIYFSLIGDIFSQSFNINGDAENRLKPPYIINNTVVSVDKIDLNQISRKINNIEVESSMTKIDTTKDIQNSIKFNINDFYINRMILKAKTFVINNVTAKNLFAKLDLNHSTFKLNDFLFNVAEGKVEGNFLYNLKHHETSLDMHISNVNANLIMDSLLGLQNQLFGSLNGEISVTCKGKSEKDCMKTLNGNGGFRVINGRMPKLGSLEYLLKASNLVKSGITGLTLNSLIDLVTPLKTGEFENINGIFSLKSGVAKDIQIFSKGKALSIYITGDYNCYESVADFQIYGKVSKKASNALGFIGNTSINTLFNLIPGIDLDNPSNLGLIKNINKIPGIELNDKSYRIFNSTVKGNLNSDNYVQSFQWLE